MSDKKTPVKNALLFVSILGFFSACQNLASDVKKTFSGADDMPKSDTSWVSLFNGKDTQGWHSYGKDSAGAAWQAKDSSLHLNASQKKGWQVRNGGDLISDKAYENFDLKLEWKISKGGNSGIMIYVQDQPEKYEYPWHTGPEMQVADNQFNEDGKIKKHHAGDLYDLVSSNPETVKSYGEWNQVEIISINGDLNFFLNGQQVLHTTLWDDHWKALIAGSKFNAMPGFGTFKKGHIALQDHGADVWFRNVKIREL